VNTTTSRTQPALIGGLIMGVLSALPIVAAGNVCCCLWIVTGGAIAAYLLQQNQPAMITPGDGALVGLFAGLIGAVVSLVLSIPITLMVGPLEHRVLERMIESTGNMPPEFRDYVGTYAGSGIRLMLFFFFMLVFGSIFSTLGGLLGAVIFRRQQAPPGPPGTIDVGPAT
jgi:hypothetical protein